jgi:hypothetical protein
MMPRKIIVGKSGRRRPDYRDYGLYSEDIALERCEIDRAIKIYTAVYWISAIICVILAVWHFMGSKFSSGAALYAGWFGFLFLYPLAIKLAQMSIGERARVTLRNVAAFQADLTDWEDNELETGVGFWRTQRGVEFETTLHRLLSRIQLEPKLTKGSRDGGVDIEFVLEGSEYWGQCKGHAKPISVGVIREIAGVCSRNSKLAAVFAVNGYTQPAQLEARNLNVRLFDAHDLARLAAQAAS